MSSITSTGSDLLSLALPTQATTSKSSAASVPVVAQTGLLNFSKSSAVGVDSVARVSDVGLDAATNKLTLSLSLKAGQKYGFNFYFKSGGPGITLVDSSGKKTTVSMANGFTVSKSGTYQLVFSAGYSLKNVASFDNLTISAKSILPTSSGDKNIDALLLGGTTDWWHSSDQVATKGAASVTSMAKGLDASSSLTSLTYSFLTAAPGGQGMNGFAEMTDAQKAAVRKALDYYSKILNVTFTESTDSSTANINFGTNNQGGKSAGYAYNPNASPSKDQTFMFLANDQSTNSDAGVQEGGYGWETILHEIGHTLGLKHPGNYNAGGGGTPGPYLSSGLDNHQYTIMSYYDNNTTRGANPTTPMLYDVAALQYLYGANTSGSTATGGSFTFSSGTSHLQTLWSTNGTDTIDLSQTTNASLVNLNAGTFSSIDITGASTSKYYSGNNNVALAYGTKIDNVTLSSSAGVADQVTLNNAYASGAFDTVGSFDASVDKIDLRSTFFGSLSAKNIEFGTAATKSTSKIVVNSTTGEIFYDADGNGTKYAAKKIAQYTLMSGGPALSTGNFKFVA